MSAYMSNYRELHPGEYVYHSPSKQEGIVKNTTILGVFVVFNYNNDPDNYQDYTGQLCKREDLVALEEFSE